MPLCRADLVGHFERGETQLTTVARETPAGPRLADPGSPSGRGVEVTRDGRTELTLQSPAPLTGYRILNAGRLEEAESLARGMPVVDSVRVYEAHSM